MSELLYRFANNKTQCLLCPNYCTLNEGEYPYNNEYGHAGGERQGLNIVDESGDRVAPGTTPDGEAVDDPGMRYVNVHDSYAEGSRYSEGCITVPHGDPDGLFDNFDWSGTYNGHTGTTGTSTGTVILIRGGNAEDTRSMLQGQQEWQQNPLQQLEPIPAIQILNR